jgi:drug/metabolite transporter (DMT)-like permease
MTGGETTHTHHRGATLMGFGAILLWASLTALSQLVTKVPALELTCITFSMAFVLALTVWRIKGEAIIPKFKMPWLQWVVGVPAVAGNIVFFFIGLKYAPTSQANMLNYLWPLELVLLSSFLPGQKLKWTHILGVVLGVLGILVLFTGRGQDSQFLPGAFWGYVAAFSGGLCWASYSVFRRATAASAGGSGSDAIMMFVGGTAIVTGLFHLVFEKTYIPVTGKEWLGLVILAAGPTYGAYGLWELGIKKGDIRMLGIGSFMIPLLSTGILVLGGWAQYSHTLMVSCLLVVAGAGMASIDALRKPKG